MSESEKPTGASAPRGTLKLKVGARTAPAKPQPKALLPKTPARNQEPSSWADEHKHRMQADMDALSAGHGAPDGRRRR